MLWQVFADQRWLTELGTSDVFGEVGVVFRVPRIATVVTSSFVDFYVLTRESFEEVHHSMFPECAPNVP